MNGYRWRGGRKEEKTDNPVMIEGKGWKEGLD